MQFAVTTNPLKKNTYPLKKNTYPCVIVGILRLLNPMGAWPACSAWVNMALHDDFTEKDSKEDVPGIRSDVSLSHVYHKSVLGTVICNDLISLLRCFRYPGLSVKKSLS